MNGKNVDANILPSKEIPDTEIGAKELPSTDVHEKQIPKIGKAENTIVIGNKIVEIKPTKLKYHRNNVASFYKIVDMMPLPEILSLQPGAFNDDRDGDKALMDWLICVVDDTQLIVENYDSIDTETVEEMLRIFKRVNHIDEKEEKQKNARSQMEMA